MDEEMCKKIEQVVEDLAPVFKLAVARIEASPATTQNHYEDYGALLTGIAATKAKALIIALALVKAGANSSGVASALKYFY